MLETRSSFTDEGPLNHIFAHEPSGAPIISTTARRGWREGKDPEVRLGIELSHGDLEHCD